MTTTRPARDRVAIRAIVDKHLYLIRETKSTEEKGKLRPDERRKIDCGTRHFEEAPHLSYAVRTPCDPLP